MLKNWSKFNESKNRDIALEEVRERFQEVRDTLAEFEDEQLIRDYRLVLKGEEIRDGGLAFDPKTGDIERWFGFVISQIENRIFYLGLEHNLLCIVANLKIPVVNTRAGNRAVQETYQVIDSEGIKKFEDIMAANSRLTSSGYTVNYDLSASHPEYKPLKVLIYFEV